ncbi:Bug family tripartite tricarboxylate transporter substrate binding protein [Advenella incenata]
MFRFAARVVKCLTLTTVVFICPTISAQEYPAKPVTLVVPFAPGSLSDATARLYAQELSNKFGQSFVVHNRPGVAGIRHVKTSAPDGLTLLWHSSAATSTQAILSDPGFDIRKDFIAVTTTLEAPLAVFAAKKTGFTTIEDVIEYAKKNPGKLNFGSAGVGTVTHLNMELFMERAGITMVHVAYKGGSPAATALMAGEIDLLIYDPAFKTSLNDKAQLLAILSTQRWPAYADVPTIEESGGPKVDAAVWNGIFAPAGTPEAVISKLNEAIKEAAHAPAVIQYMELNGYIPSWRERKQFDNEVKAEVAQWQELVRRANVPIR